MDVGDYDMGSRRRRSGRSSRRSRRSRKSRKSEKSYKSAKKYLKHLAKKPYKAHKAYVKEVDRKNRSRSKLVDDDRARFMAMQAINFAGKIDKLNEGAAGALGEPLKDDSQWDTLKQQAIDYFSGVDGKDAKKSLNEFKYLLVNVEPRAENDEALSRILAMSKESFNTPLGKKMLQELIRVVYLWAPTMKRTLRTLERLYQPYTYALRKGLVPRTKQDFSFEQGLKSSSNNAFGS
jgi:hypothetical protein